MREIRPIRETECQEFLQLLCDVFALDFNAAYAIFFTEPFFDLNRKWALFEAGEMISILTTTPLIFGWGRAIGIAGVATRPSRQQEGHASRLLQKVLSVADRNGEGAALLLATDLRIYEKNDFEPIDRVIRAELKCRDEREPVQFSTGETRFIYDAWAEAHPDRLRRDEQRWKFWDWNFRIATQFQDGYLCAEPGLLREAIYSPAAASLPLPRNSEWFGTTFITDQLELPVDRIRVEMYLCGHNFPGIPQMFMTDQF